MRRMRFHVAIAVLISKQVFSRLIEHPDMALLHSFKQWLMEEGRSKEAGQLTLFRDICRMKELDGKPKHALATELFEVFT